jgi:hypothetical protein
MHHRKFLNAETLPRVSSTVVTQACEDFVATIIIGEMGYTKCHDSKNVNGFYVSRTDFLQFHIYVIS